MNLDARKIKFDQVDIYPVTCEKLSLGRSNTDILRAVIEGGAKIVQLREKDLSKKDLHQLALKFREITGEAGVLLIINDHVDIALSVEADGVHLGQEDLPLAAARMIAPDLLIGASTHSLEEAILAQEEGANYINIGPIFPTKTKDGVDRYLGPEVISVIAPKLKVPFTVMGGITEQNIDEVLFRGARRVAVVTAVTKAQDVAVRVAFLRERIMNAGDHQTEGRRVDIDSEREKK